MTTSRTTIVKNASVMLVAQLVTWALTFLLTIFQPRFLGPAVTGELYLAIALWSVAGVFISFGMDTMLTKTIARDPAHAVELLGTSLWIRLFFYPVSGLAIALYMVLTGFSQHTMMVVFLIGVSVIIWQLIAGVQAVLQGLEIMEYISLATIVGKAINTFCGITVLLMGFGLFSLALVMVVAASVSLVIQLYYLNKVQPLSFKLRLAAVIPMLRLSLPYVMATLVHTAYQYINTIILGAKMESTQVGWYSTSATLFGTLLFLPVAFATATFPSLSRAHIQSPDELPAMFRKTIDLLMVGGVPVSFGLISIAAPLIELLYGPAFAPSAAVLQVLGVTLIFTYFNILIGQYFTSIDRQNTWTITIALFTAVMVAANIALIPLFHAQFGNGAVGAATGLLIAEAGMTLTGIVLLRKLLGWRNVWTAVRVLLVGFVMMATVWLLRETFILVQVAAGGLVYVAGVGLLRIVPADDLKLLQEFALRVLGKVRRRRVSPGSTSA